MCSTFFIGQSTESESHLKTKVHWLASYGQKRSMSLGEAHSYVNQSFTARNQVIFLKQDASFEFFFIFIVNKDKIDSILLFEILFFVNYKI